MSAASDPRWLEDPSPSFDEMAERVGVEHRPPAPGEHFMGDDLTIAAYWPGEPPA